MIIQLQLENKVRFHNRNFKRWLHAQKLNSRRVVKAGIRKTRSRSLAWYRSQYFVTSAYRDMRGGISRNEDIFISVLIIAMVLSYAYAVLASQIFTSFFLTTYILSETVGINMLLLGAFATGVLAVMLSWLSAFVLNMCSIAIYQGANGNKLRSTRSTVREGLRKAPRTSLIWLSMAVRALAPVGIVGLSGVVVGKTGLYEQPAILYGLAVAALLAIVLSARTVMRDSLLPYVTLFETSLDHDQAAERSARLTSRRGRVFVLSIYAMFAAAIAGVYAVARLADEYMRMEWSVVFGLGAITTMLLANGIMTMFYRKRRLARTR